MESNVKETFFNEIDNLKKENDDLKARLENLSNIETEEVVEDEKTKLSTE